MDLIIQRNQNMQEKIIKRVVSIDTALLDTFRYTFCKKDISKCFMACSSSGECMPMRNDASRTEKKESMVSRESCRNECIARNMYKNRAFPVDSANFTMDTPEKVYKALSMEVTHLSLPIKIHNISGELRNNYFRINEKVFEIPSGMYTIQKLVNVISIAVATDNIGFYYDSVIDRVYISKTDDTLDKIIEFSHREGCQNMELNTTLGWALGFRMPAYSLDSNGPADGLHYQTVTAKQSELKGNWPNQKYSNSEMPFLTGSGKIEGIVAEASPSIRMDYLYMIVDEYNRNKNDEYMTTANKFSNVIAKVPLITTNDGISVNYDCFYDINRKRTYFSPINVEKLKIQLLDRFGRKVDLGINTINASVEFECAYS